MEKVIGIVGEGKMGASIFNYLIDFGFKLVWLVSLAADTVKMKKQLLRKITRSYEAGIIEKEVYDILLQTVISPDMESLSSCQLIIEAIPESSELKKNLFSELDPIVNPECIFASNSSSFNPSLLSPHSSRREKFIGLHFFYPVPLKNIVEVITTPHSTLQTEKEICLFLDKIKRKFLLLDEKNSFVLNRLYLDFQNEAFLIVQQGKITYKQMDQLVKENFFHFGVFDFCDSVGIDTMRISVKNYTAGSPPLTYYQPFLEKLDELCLKGRLGIKTSAGFYDYPLSEEKIEIPAGAGEIIDHLRFTFHNAAKRFTALSHLPVGEMNDAIKEYFSLEKGPFE